MLQAAVPPLCGNPQRCLSPASRAQQGPRHAELHESVRAEWVEHADHEQATRAQHPADLKQHLCGIGVLEYTQHQHDVERRVVERQILGAPLEDMDAGQVRGAAPAGLHHFRGAVECGDLEPSPTGLGERGCRLPRPAAQN